MGSSSRYLHIKSPGGWVRKYTYTSVEFHSLMMKRCLIHAHLAISPPSKLWRKRQPSLVMVTTWQYSSSNATARTCRSFFHRGHSISSSKLQAGCKALTSPRLSVEMIQELFASKIKIFKKGLGQKACLSSKICPHGDGLQRRDAPF